MLIYTVTFIAYMTSVFPPL